MKTRDLTLGALLTALAIVIPTVFGGFLRVTLPPFTATLASHVPMYLSMLISPFAALMVGAGSTIGFMITAPAVVAARAAMHIIVGYVGAVLIKKGTPAVWAFALTIPIHGVLEALVVIPFGFTQYQALVVVGVGTVLHNVADAIIATSAIYLLKPYFKLKPIFR